MLEEIAHQIAENISEKALVPVSGIAELPVLIALQAILEEPRFFAVVNLVGLPQDCFKKLISSQSTNPSYSTEYPINQIPITISLLIRTYASTANELDNAVQQIFDSLGHEFKFSSPGVKADAKVSCSIKLKTLDNYSKEGSLVTLDIMSDETTSECILPLDYTAIDINSASPNSYTLNELLCAYIHYQHLINDTSHPESIELQKRIERISSAIGPALCHAGNALTSLEGLQSALDHVHATTQKPADPQ